MIYRTQLHLTMTKTENVLIMATIKENSTVASRSTLDREVDAYRQELEAQDKEQSLFDGTNEKKA